MRWRISAALVALALAALLAGLDWPGSSEPDPPQVTFAGDWPMAAVTVENCRWRAERLVCEVAAAEGREVPPDSLTVDVLDDQGVRIDARHFPDVTLGGGERAYLVAYTGEGDWLEPGRLTLRFAPARKAYWKAGELKEGVSERLRELMDALEGFSGESLEDLMESPPESR